MKCRAKIQALEKAGELEAEYLVCKSGTYISFAHKGSGDLNTHVLSKKYINAVRAAAASKKLQIALTQQDTEKMASLLQKALTPFTLLNIKIAICLWTVHLLCLKRFSLILM